MISANDPNRKGDRNLREAFRDAIVGWRSQQGCPSHEELLTFGQRGFSRRRRLSVWWHVCVRGCALCAIDLSHSGKGVAVPVAFSPRVLSTLRHGWGGGLARFSRALDVMFSWLRSSSHELIRQKALNGYVFIGAAILFLSVFFRPMLLEQVHHIGPLVGNSQPREGRQQKTKGAHQIIRAENSPTQIPEAFAGEQDASTGGRQVWGPQHFDNAPGPGHGAQVPVVQGYFNVILGPVDTTGARLPDAFNANSASLEIVGTDDPLPCQQVLTGPFAFKSEQMSAMAFQPDCSLSIQLLGGLEDRRYFLQASANLMHWTQLGQDLSPWTCVFTNVATGDCMNSVYGDVPRYPSRFYRAVLYDTDEELSAIAYQPHGSLSFQLAGLKGRSYVLQASANLKDWTNMHTNVAAGGSIQFSIEPGQMLPHPFFRVQSR